jgi:hypothetical protein
VVLFIGGSFLSPFSLSPVGAGEAKIFGFTGSCRLFEREREERENFSNEQLMCQLEPNPPESTKEGHSVISFHMFESGRQFRKQMTILIEKVRNTFVAD